MRAKPSLSTRALIPIMTTSSSRAEAKSWLPTDSKGRPDEETIMEYSVKVNGTEKSRSKDKSWWARRSSLEKGLVAGLTLCSMLSIALIIAVIVISEKNDETLPTVPPEKAVCTTRDCVVAASRVAQSIDFTVKPCDDFYTFACGRWMEVNVIPEDRSSQNTFGILRDDVDVILKNLLEENETFHEPVLKKPKDLYASCMNLDKLEELGDQPLRNFLEKLGGWPMILGSAWDQSNFDLTHTLLTISLYNTEPLVDINVNTDLKNSTARILYIDQPGFALPGRKYYLVARNDSNILAYETLIKNVALALQPNATAIDIYVKNLVDFEIQVANITVPDEDRRDNEKLYNKYTLSQLAANFTGMIRWTEYINGLMGHPDVKVPITPDEPIINRSPEYFYRLLALLEKTDNRTLGDFLIWRSINNRASSLDHRYREFYLNYNKILSGTASERARFRKCVADVTNVMGLGVGHMFVKRTFDEDAKDRALEMIKELKKAFNELLDDLDWMEPPTKKVAREKIEFIDEKIGYPDEALNITYLTIIYENYTYRPDTYFDNVINNLEQSFRENLRDLRKPVDKTQWSTAPSTVNAYYNSARNQIMFPAGILQPPFFSKTYPRSLNFGGIGVVIGHEITHGFDDRGRQYDKDGNLKQWWSDQDITNFKRNAQCIVNQYGNYTVPEADMKINGINTQGENIADNGGLKQSYRAYKNWVRSQRSGQEEPLLPGLEEFNNDQLFFINFAQIWCTKMRREDAINRILTGVHSPGQFRVIGTLHNSLDFATAFSCPQEKSYMNPKHKCNVW